MFLVWLMISSYICQELYDGRNSFTFVTGICFHDNQIENGCLKIYLRSNRNSDFVFATLHYFLAIGKESGDPVSYIWEKNPQNLALSTMKFECILKYTLFCFRNSAI